jgi:hypothetical protein
MYNDSTLDLFIRISQHRMIDNYLPKLTLCINELSEQNIWVNEFPGANSIGGITLHICEHLERHIHNNHNSSVAYIKGIEEYFPHRKMTNQELIQNITRVFESWADSLGSIQAEANFNMHGLYHLVEHTGYHLGQIVDRTQRLTLQQFQFVQNGLNEKHLKSLIDQKMEGR